MTILQWPCSTATVTAHRSSSWNGTDPVLEPKYGERRGDDDAGFGAGVAEGSHDSEWSDPDSPELVTTATSSAMRFWPWLFRPRILITTASSGVALLGLAAFSIHAYGRWQQARDSYDLIVVAGCRAREGKTPSEAVRRRVQVAVRHWQAGRASQLLFTGGTGTHPPSEARAAANMARGLGVSDEALLLEERSMSIWENARFARPLTSARRSLVVTDCYQVSRARSVFTQYFACVDAVGSLAPATTRMAGALREVGAVAIYRLREWSGTLPQTGDAQRVVRRPRARSDRQPAPVAQMRRALGAVPDGS